MPIMYRHLVWGAGMSWEICRVIWAFVRVSRVDIVFGMGLSLFLLEERLGVTVLFDSSFSFTIGSSSSSYPRLFTQHIHPTTLSSSPSPLPLSDRSRATMFSHRGFENKLGSHSSEPFSNHLGPRKWALSCVWVSFWKAREELRAREGMSERVAGAR